MLQSLLLQRSKPEPEKLRSLLRCSSKQASELAALQQQASKLRSWRSFGACCVATTSKLRSLLRCSSKQAPELSGARSLLAEQQAPELSGALRSSELAGQAAGSGGLRSSELSKDVR
jgi:hypothetical protein